MILTLADRAGKPPLDLGVPRSHKSHWKGELSPDCHFTAERGEPRLGCCGCGPSSAESKKGRPARSQSGEPPGFDAAVWPSFFATVFPILLRGCAHRRVACCSRPIKPESTQIEKPDRSRPARTRFGVEMRQRQPPARPQSCVRRFARSAWPSRPCQGKASRAGRGTRLVACVIEDAHRRSHLQLVGGSILPWTELPTSIGLFFTSRAGPSHGRRSGRGNRAA